MPNNDISLKVATPAGVFMGIFEKTTKIIEVIKKIIKKQGLEEGDDFDLFYQGKALQPEERPLVSFHLPDEVCLELVATGSGV